MHTAQEAQQSNKSAEANPNQPSEVRILGKIFSAMLQTLRKIAEITRITLERMSVSALRHTEQIAAFDSRVLMQNSACTPKHLKGVGLQV